MGERNETRTPILIQVLPSVPVSGAVKLELERSWGIRLSESTLKLIYGSVFLWLDELKAMLERLLGAENYELVTVRLIPEKFIY